jgi:uncharacterized protein YndB with AHSA1/START domain
MNFSFYKKQQQRGGREDYIQGTVIVFTPSKLDYTWEIPGMPNSKSVVTWELEEIENNKTRLNLMDTGTKSDKMLKEADGGWTYFLNELVKYCEKIK